MGVYLTSPNSKNNLLIVFLLIVVIYMFFSEDLLKKWNTNERAKELDEGFTTNPSASSPVSTNPSTSSPGSTNPSASSPVSTNPSASSPGSTNPSASSPVSTNPSASSPSSTVGLSQDVTTPPSTCVLGRPGSNNKSIIAKHSGAAYNIEFANPGYTFFIYQKPFRTGENNHVFSVVNNSLYIAPKDDSSVRQKWIMVKGVGDDKYIVPYGEAKRVDGVSVHNVLQYDGGFLTLRPKSDFESQKWIYDDTGPVKYGIKSCVLDSDKIQSNANLNGIENKDVHEMYKQKMGSILSLIQSNLNHFNNSVSSKTSGGKTVSSVFGKGEPIKLTVNVHGFNDKESFNDANGSNEQLELLKKLDQFEQNENFNSSPNNLQSRLKVQECKKVDLKDYVDYRVGSCNCKLDDL